MLDLRNGQKACLKLVLEIATRLTRLLFSPVRDTLDKLHWGLNKVEGSQDQRVDILGVLDGLQAHVESIVRANESDMGRCLLSPLREFLRRLTSPLVEQVSLVL